MANFPASRTFHAFNQGTWVAFISSTFNMYTVIICTWGDHSGLFTKLLGEMVLSECNAPYLDLLFMTCSEKLEVILFLLCPNNLKSWEDELKRAKITLLSRICYDLSSVLLCNFKMSQGLRTPHSNPGVRIFAPVMAATDKMWLSSREVSNKNVVPYQKSVCISHPAPALCLSLKCFSDMTVQACYVFLEPVCHYGQVKRNMNTVTSQASHWLTPKSHFQSQQWGETQNSLFSHCQEFHPFTMGALHLSASHHKTTAKERADSLCNWKSPWGLAVWVAHIVDVPILPQKPD